MMVLEELRKFRSQYSDEIIQECDALVEMPRSNNVKSGVLVNTDDPEDAQRYLYFCFETTGSAFRTHIHPALMFQGESEVLVHFQLHEVRVDFQAASLYAKISHSKLSEPTHTMLPLAQTSEIVKIMYPNNKIYRIPRGKQSVILIAPNN